VKWAYQPVKAQDIPGAIMRAYAIAFVSRFGNGKEQKSLKVNLQ